MKKILRCIAILLCTATLLVPSAFPVSAVSGNDYYTYLISLGFPDAYAEKLAELHILHPNWTFEPLLVTELNSSYTWSYVIHMETDDNVKRSLVSSSSAYTAYRHPTNTTLYDTGWYQASAAAVEYMMDPRNFLNEKDIFQFEDLSFKDSVTVAQIESSLVGTFMAGAYLENGKTYAEYFWEVGKELGISPLHLAARARQEQGIYGTSPQITGTCGDRLWYYYSNNIQYEGNSYIKAPSSGYTEASLKQYNGLYNFFNINAAGTGKFAVLLGAMQEAQTGTASMASVWGGSGKWDTKWKSIYGGAYKLCSSYIGNYQNTLYLQKWNVDNRSKTSSGSSRNFWGQYMQNIGAALSEARTTYTSLAANGCLDCAYRFLVPVYSGMPSSCPDPANGSCLAYAVSDIKYSYVNQLDLPVSASSRNGYIKTNKISAVSGNSVSVSGWSVHTYGLDGYEYSIDGGNWISMSSSFRQDVATSNAGYINCILSTSINSFSADISTKGLSSGNHMIALRGAADYGSSAGYIDSSYYLIAVIDLEVTNSANVTVTVNVDSGVTTSNAAMNSVYILPQAPSEPANDSYFAGWSVVSDTAHMFLPAGAGITLLGNISITPVYIDIRTLNGASLKISEPTYLRFTAAISYDGYKALTDAAGERNISLGMIIVKTSDLGILVPNPVILDAAGKTYTKTSAAEWCHIAEKSGEYFGFTGDTANINSDDYSTAYSAVAYICIKYTNSSVAYICSSYSAVNNSRSAKYVARAALADTSKSYSNSARETLGKIAQ